jgi:hypothetical protein
LKHLVVREKAILDQLEDFAFISGGFLEHIWTRGGHGKGRRILGKSARRARESEVCKRREEMVSAEESGLGFNLSPLFIEVTMKGGGGA